MSTLIGAFKSRTIYVNVAVAIGGAILNSLSAAGIDPVWYAGIVAAINIGLRAITTEALADKA